MEKNNKTKIVAVISSVILLLLVIGASFAYFGSFETNLNNNVAVNIITASPGNATFVSNATFLDLNVSAGKMDLMNSDDNTPALSNEANLIISLTSGSDNLKTTCTYDIIYEYDYTSKVYGEGEETVTSGATKEITLEVKGNGGTNNYSEEKNFNYDSSWTAKDDTNKIGPKKVLVSSVTIENSSANTPTVQNFTFTGRYYNLSLNQKQLINKSFTGKIYAESKECETKEIVSKAYEVILSNNGGKDAIEAKSKPTFSQSAKENGNVYATDDDYGTSYYFRGAVDNNWVKFGEVDGKPIYWRIIRINGDGSIRLLYSGTTAPIESQKVVMAGEGTQIGTSAFNDNEDKTEYVGYKYEIGKQHGLANDSTIKTTLENWYKTTTLYTEESASQLVVDIPFCYDRTASTNDTGEYGEIDDWQSVLPAGISYYYGSYGRTWSGSWNPSLKCTNALDKYSKSRETLLYPAGLITADEIVFAGGILSDENSTYYLYTGQIYWSGSPSAISFRNPISAIFTVGNNGDLNSYRVSSNIGVRPVINLSADASISGNGTWNNPYIFS